MDVHVVYYRLLPGRHKEQDGEKGEKGVNLRETTIQLYFAESLALTTLKSCVRIENNGMPCGLYDMGDEARGDSRWKKQRSGTMLIDQEAVTEFRMQKEEYLKGAASDLRVAFRERRCV